MTTKYDDYMDMDEHMLHRYHGVTPPLLQALADELGMADVVVVELSNRQREALDRAVQKVAGADIKPLRHSRRNLHSSFGHGWAEELNPYTPKGTA